MNDTPATQLSCVRISPDNQFVQDERGAADELKLKDAVTAVVDAILAISDAAHVDRAKLYVTKLKEKNEAEKIKLTDKAYKGIEDENLKRISAEAQAKKAELTGKIKEGLGAGLDVLQRKFNRPSSGPHEDIVTVYVEGDKIGLANRAYEDLNDNDEKPKKSFKELFNDPSEPDVSKLPKKVQDYLAGLAGNETAKPRLPRARRHARALATVWAEEDVVRAVQKILGLGIAAKASADPKPYEWCGQSLKTKDYVHSHTIALVPGSEDSGSVREMQVVTDAVRASGLEHYWKYALPAARFGTKAGGPGGDKLDMVASVDNYFREIKRRLELPRTDREWIEATPERLGALKRSISDLREIATVGDLLWDRGLFLQSVWDGRILSKASPSWYQYLGYSPVEFHKICANGEFTSGVLADAASRVAFHESQDALSYGEGHRFNIYRMLAADGGVFTVSEHASGLGKGLVYRNARIHPETYVAPSAI